MLMTAHIGRAGQLVALVISLGGGGESQRYLKDTGLVLR